MDMGREGGRERGRTAHLEEEKKEKIVRCVRTMLRAFTSPSSVGAAAAWSCSESSSAEEEVEEEEELSESEASAEAEEEPDAEGAEDEEESPACEAS